MTVDATKAVLLARDGEARTRMQSALDAIGAEVVLVTDPGETDPAQVKALQPDVVLVALEPAIEPALDAYEGLFADPGITVVFDEADLAAKREGWDAARWTRHLAAKLQGRHDVLPPGGESDEDLLPTPGPLPERAELGEIDAALFAVEATELASEVPRDDGYLTAHDRNLDDVDTGDDVTTGPGRSQGEEVLQLEAQENDEETGADSSSSTMFSNLSLVDDESPELSTGAELGPVLDTEHGAVVIEGGIGGPDAVRQLLSALPKGFPRPVLVRLQLDGGRYDRLVQQMGRASLMPALLAEVGQSITAGTVYFLAPGTGLGREQGRLQFVESTDAPAELYAQLPADDCAVILLSGSELSLVDAAVSHGDKGAMIAAQPAEECYEPSAAAELARRGGVSCSLTDLAQRLDARWPT